MDILLGQGEVTTRASWAALSLTEVTWRAQRLPDHRGWLLDVQIGKNTHAVFNFWVFTIFSMNHVHISAPHKMNCLTLLIVKTLPEAKCQPRASLFTTKCIFYWELMTCFVLTLFIFEAGGVTAPQTLCSRNVSLFAPPCYHDDTKLDKDTGIMRMCWLFRLTKTNVGDPSQGRERVSIIWLTAWAGRRVERLTYIGALYLSF